MIIKSIKQPKGFSVFFLTEMWERYGFYIIQTLLVFYLSNKLSLKDSQVYIIAGSFTALAYINGFFGGLIADNLTNYSTSILCGCLLLFIGYNIIAFNQNFEMLLLGLAIVSVGTGLLKPNVSSMLSILYTDENYKDSGYILYYIGIYFGAVGGSFIGGYLQKWFGFKIAFLSSTFGIFFSFIVFYIGKIKFNLVDKRRINISYFNYFKAIISIIFLIIISNLILYFEKFSLIYFILITLISYCYLISLLLKHKGDERKRILAFLILVTLATLYWAIYFQQFFSLSLATSRITKLYNLPPSSIPSIVSLGVIIFGPIVNYAWIKLRQNKMEITIPLKFSLGYFFNSLCFLLLVFGVWYSIHTNDLLDLSFIVFSYILIAVGEIIISPVSLSMVSTLITPRYTSALMGISLLSIGLGSKLAGILADKSSINNLNLNLQNIKYIYLKSFFYYFLISSIAFTIAIILSKYINKLIRKAG